MAIPELYITFASSLTTVITKYNSVSETPEQMTRWEYILKDSRGGSATFIGTWPPNDWYVPMLNPNPDSPYMPIGISAINLMRQLMTAHKDRFVTRAYNHRDIVADIKEVEDDAGNAVFTFSASRLTYIPTEYQHYYRKPPPPPQLFNIVNGQKVPI